jgi:hypothetical protein
VKRPSRPNETVTTSDTMHLGSPPATLLLGCERLGPVYSDAQARDQAVHPEKVYTLGVAGADAQRGRPVKAGGREAGSSSM